MTDPGSFAEDLSLAKDYIRMLLETFTRLREDTVLRLGIPGERLSEASKLP